MITTTLQCHNQNIQLTMLGVPGATGQPGPSGGDILHKVGPNPIGGHRVVAYDDNGLLVYADATDAAQLGRVVGITEAAYSPGADAVVARYKLVTFSGWSFAAGPVLIGSNGNLTQSLPVGAEWSQVLGYALDATTVYINPQLPIKVV